MITLNLERHDRGTLCSRDTRQETPLDALRFVVASELQFGAEIVSVEPDHLHLHTHVCGMLDVTHLHGSPDEMQSIVQTVAMFARADMDLVASGAAAEFCRITGGVPALLELAMPLVMGHARLRIMVMLSLGFQDRADLERAAGMSCGDLFALVALLNEQPGSTFTALADCLAV